MINLCIGYIKNRAQTCIIQKTNYTYSDPIKLMTDNNNNIFQVSFVVVKIKIPIN